MYLILRLILLLKYQKFLSYVVKKLQKQGASELGKCVNFDAGKLAGLEFGVWKTSIVKEKVLATLD